MTQEEKDLIIKDLCSRLPYGVKFVITKNVYTATGLDLIVTDEGNWEYAITAKGIVPIEIELIKPYLFPLSSMTKEQEEELITITNGKFRYMWGKITNAIPRDTSEWGVDKNAWINGMKEINILYIWLLKNHFDIYDLIPMGLAIDATELNIY